MTSNKDIYNTIATAIKKLYEHESEEDHREVSEAFADVLSKSPNFDHDQFLKDCGLPY